MVHETVTLKTPLTLFFQMAETSTSHGSTPGWPENPIYGIKGGEKPHPEFRDLNFNRYIWCLSADATRRRWWLGAAGPIAAPFKPPTKTKDFQYSHRVKLVWKPYTPGTCVKCNTQCFYPVWTGLKKDKKYSREVANMQPPKVINGYVQGAFNPGLELTGESRLTFCKTCWRNIGHRSSVSRFDHPHGDDTPPDCSCSAGCFGLYGCSSEIGRASCRERV